MYCIEQNELILHNLFYKIANIEVEPIDQNKSVSRSGSAFGYPFAINNFNNGFIDLGSSNDIISRDKSKNFLPNKDMYFNYNQETIIFDFMTNNMGNMRYEGLINNTSTSIFY